MNILQVSAPKSGSFWLNTILRNILQKKQIPIDSFIQKQPVYEKVKQTQLSFKGQAGIDMIDIQEDGCYYRISSVVKEPINDLYDYRNSATLAWTHSTWCTKSREVFPHFDKKVCIVRDPRDRALSSAKFAFTPYMQKYYPTTYSTPEEHFTAEYERLLEQWVWFYGNYLLHKEELDLHFVFYKNLLSNFDAEFDRLLEYLELPLSAAEKAEIKEAVTFEAMKEESPRHLQKGKSRKWIEKLSEQEQQKAIEKAGVLMDLFGYSPTPENEEKLLSLPNNLPKGKLEEMLKKIDWRKLY